MRVNTKKALDAWKQHKACKPAQSIHTDGERIYSYSTCIVERLENGVVVMNRTSYSVTTTIHQNALAVYVCSDVTANDVPRGTRSLERYAKAEV